MPGLLIPPTWERLTLPVLNGLILIIGAPDSGKTTFARFLYRRLYDNHKRVAFVDGDMGQATLGPPTTMTLALGRTADNSFPPMGPRYHAFVGDVTPRRHMLPTLVGAHRLVRKAEEEGATAIVFDTTGLIDPAYGGGRLKQAKIDLLRPTAVVGLERGNELEHLLVPLRCSRRTRVIDLSVSHAASPRSPATRRAHRAVQFRRYFEKAHTLTMNVQHKAVFPKPVFTRHRLMALEDQSGFALALGITIDHDRARKTLTLHTPLARSVEIDALHLGNLTLDPEAFRESRLRS